MSKHTPGPWEWTTSDSGPEDEWGCTTRGLIDVAAFRSKGYCGNPELYGPDDECVVSAGSGEYTPFDGKDHATAVANARLIAAAPDLLAAAEAATEALYDLAPMLDYHEISDGKAQRAHEKLSAAIRRARGEE